jgi:hypothetical protein
MKNNIKEIYSFPVLRKVKKEVTDEQADGTKIIKTVEENEPVKIIFKNPSRQEREEADLVYAVEYGRCVRAGVLTSPLIEKLYDEKEKSGILSDDFAAKYLHLYERFFEIQNEFTRLDLKEEKTKEDENRLTEVAAEFAKIRNELQNLESSRNSLFQNTAETKAQNKTILWLTLFLTYMQEPEKNTIPFFEGKTFEEKLNTYDKLVEQNDEFVYKVIDKIAFFISLWYLRKASTKDDFDSIERSLNETAPAAVEEKEPVKEPVKETVVEEKPIEPKKKKVKESKDEVSL